MRNTYQTLPERRRHPRVLVQMPLRCIRLDPANVDVVDTLHTLDISRSGLGAHTDRAYYPGQRILLDMPMSETHGRRRIYASVKRCSQDSQGYRVGLKFDSVIIGAFYAGQGLPAVLAA